MPHSQPNLLFIMTDHQRADSLGMVQCGMEVTPHLNHLAQESTVFTRAYSTSPLCVPARTALATGLYPTKSGVVINRSQAESTQDSVTLHEHLHRAGYDVAHIGVAHIRLQPDLKERLPYAVWIDHTDHDEYLAAKGLQKVGGRPAYRSTIQQRQGDEYVPASYSNTRTGVWEGTLDDFKDLFFGRHAVEFLRRPRTRPFALFLYLWAPHPPLIVPEPYASRFAPDRIELPPNVGKPAQGEPANRRRGAAAQLAEGLSEDEWRRVWAAHLGLVNMADDVIGEVLAALDESGAADNTIVLFTVDHGDHLGQHAMYQKMELYEQAIHIPLVIRHPKLAPQRFDFPVSHLDLLPTVLELLNIPLPGDYDGRSLVPALRSGENMPSEPVYAQYSGNQAVGDIRRAVITERYKYVYDPDDIAELYDLAEDPLETVNVAEDPAYRDVVQELHRLCRDWGKAHGDWIWGDEA